MNDRLIVSEAARELTDRLGVVVRPRDITDVFYQRLIADDRCPIVGGRRLIPWDFLPAIAETVRGRVMGRGGPHE